MVREILFVQDKTKIIKTIYQEILATMIVDEHINDFNNICLILYGVFWSVLVNEIRHVILMSNDIKKILVAVRLARTSKKLFENIFIVTVTKAAIMHWLLLVTCFIGSLFLRLWGVSWYLLQHAYDIKQNLGNHEKLIMFYSQCFIMYICF